VVVNPTPQELADLAAEAVNAVIETQKSYAFDWTKQVHGEAWKSEKKASIAQ
jgi:hypothetical protein